MNKKVGIYRIDCVSNGSFYIGSASDMRKRWASHRHHLRKGIHDNPHMVAIYKKYGMDSLVFSIVEYCERSALLEREQHYIDTLCPDINIVRVAGSTVGHKRTETQKLQQQLKQGRRIYQIHPETGVIVNEYTSAIRAGIALQKSHSEIGRAAKQGKNNTVGGYLWAYVDEWKPENFVPTALRTRRKVMGIDAEGNEVVYLSARHAAHALGLSPKTIWGVISSRKTAKGYTFRYLEYEK